jgi:hypothetical protein
MPVTKPEFSNAKPDDVKPDDVKPDETPNDRAKTVAAGRTASAETVKQDLPEVKEDPNANPASYVWLANGEVLRVNDEDLPAGGHGAQHGFWQKDGSAHTIVGVYPVEQDTEG